MEEIKNKSYVIDESQAITVVFHRKSLKLSLGSTSVPCVKSINDDENEDKGPLPCGKYLIDTVRTHPDYKCDWFNLHAELPEKDRYYGYGDRVYLKLFRRRRCNFAIHP